MTIVSKEKDANSLRLLFRVPEPTSSRADILPYVIEKGYIALDGTSLTVTSVSDSDRTFGVMLIAHTQTKVQLPQKEVGERVNVEVDMVGKYVQKAVLASLGGLGSGAFQGLVDEAVQRSLAKSGINRALSD